MGSASSALEVASWRRQVHALYADVRTFSDPADAHAEWVQRRTAMFLEHPASPRMEGQQLRHTDYDPAYRFTVALEPADPEEWVYATATDGDVPFERAGRFTLANDQHRLGSVDVWWLASYGGGLFVPLRDGSCGDTSYGAGRYLLDTVKGADLGRDGEEWVVDLNFAYNPSCAYDPAWACPLAPAGNRIEAVVPVGELTPGTSD